MKLAALLVCLGMLVARRPDAVLLPQFWAEDGPTFFEPAFAGHGRAALLVPYARYLHLFPRLVAWATTLAPPEHAPALFNGTAILVAGLCIWLFTLPLARALLPSDGLRLALCLLFLLSNPAVETYSNLANLHWWMTLGTLILISVPLEGRWLVPLSCGLIGMTTLSSALPIFLVPVALLTTLKGDRRYRTAGTTLLVGVAVQLIARHFLPGWEPNLPPARSVPVVLGYTLDACHVTLLQLIPGYELASALHAATPWVGWAIAGLLFALLSGRALWPWSLRQGLLAAGAVYVMGIVLMFAVLTRWLFLPSELLLRTPVPLGGRYLFLPYAACVFLLGLAVQQGLRGPILSARAPVLALFAAAALGSIGGRPPMIHLEDLEWRRHVSEARQQRWTKIPINPEGWSVQLQMPPP
jgi:hypothetical protein